MNKDTIVVSISSCVDAAFEIALNLNKRLDQLDKGYDYAFVKESSKSYGFVVYMPEASFNALGYEQRSDLSEFF